MSWSCGAIGHPVAVAASVATQLGAYTCAEPEESIKQAAGVLIAEALSRIVPEMVVKVQASGSQFAEAGVVKYGSLTIVVEPVLGWVE